MQDTKKWYKISDLERLSGVSRRTIHFYLQSRLLHPPKKTGKTMSYYDQEHLRRLEMIKQMKMQGMPLFQIKEKFEKVTINQEVMADLRKTGVETPGAGGGKEKKIPIRARARETRNKIIECGCDFFWRKGYRETGVSDITRALNVGKGTFYFYFKDKKALFLECMPLIFEALFSKGWQQIRKAQTPLRRLELRAQAVFPVLPKFCSIIQLCREAMEDPNPTVRKMGRDTLLSIRRPLEADIEKGIAGGVLRDVNPRIVGSMMIAMIENMHYLKNLDADLDHGRMWECISGMLISGIKNRQKL